MYLASCTLLVAKHHCIYLKGFNYNGTAKELKKQLEKLSKLSYDNMKTSLFANEVITSKEKKVIDNKIGHEKMEHLLEEIIIPSLEQGNGKKYKFFLKVMEDNEDIDLNHTAAMLGMFKYGLKVTYLMYVCIAKYCSSVLCASTFVD